MWKASNFKAVNVTLLCWKNTCKAKVNWSQNDIIGKM